MELNTCIINIDTPNGAILFVKVSRRLKSFTVVKNILWLHQFRNYVLLPECIGDIEWRFVDRASNVTERQAEWFIESKMFRDEYLGIVTYYRDYPNELSESCLLTAKQGLYTMLYHHGIKESDFDKYAVLYRENI